MKQISFGGAGCYTFGYLALFNKLQEIHNFDNYIFGAVSGGCFPALLVALNVPISHIIPDIIEGLTRANLFNSISIITNTLRKRVFLHPEDYKKLNSKLYISVTRLSCCGLQNEIISEWNSNEEVIDTIIASSYIPFVVGPYPYYKVQGKKYIDGGITNNLVIPDSCMQSILVVPGILNTRYSMHHTLMIRSQKVVFDIMEDWSSDNTVFRFEQLLLQA